MSMPLVSVIVPVYNTEKYLPRCVDSILNGTYQNIEVVCVDDGSSDKSLDILREYERKDARVRVIHQDNAGVSAARNIGLDKSVGDLIAFIDSDDWVHPQYLEELVTTMNLTRANVVVCGFKIVGTETVENISIRQKAVGRVLSLDGVLNSGHVKVNIWARVYSREVIGENRFDTELSFAEDTVFNLAVLCKYSLLKLVQIDTELYYYYMRDDSAIHTLKHSSVMKTAKQVYLKDYEDFGKNKTIILEQTFRALLSARYLESFNHNSESQSECENLIHQALIHIDDLNLIKRILYRGLIMFPELYRLFRIITDPTMLHWERNERKKYQQ